MGGIFSLFLLCMVFSGSVLGRQQEGDSVARRVRVPWPLAFCQEALWVDDDAEPTDVPRREWKGKSSVAEVNSRCTKQEEEGTVKARPAKGISFSKGDWQQFPNAPPILPFNASDEQHSGAANQLDPVHLASFSLTNFQGEGGRISGYLLLEITTSNNINDNIFHGFYNFSNDEAFQSQRDYSALKIDLEGLMHETEEEITLCMLGCTMLPSSLSLLEEDCNVMFQMQYPKKLSLTRSVIRAQVTSLLNAGEKHHFHPINVTALPPINRMPPYEYTVADVIDQICSNVTAETLAMDEDSFPGFALRRLFDYDFSVGFDVQPSLDCSKSKAFCDNMGPLGSTVGQGENLPHNGLAIPVFRYTRISAAEIHVSALLQFHHGGGGILYHHHGAFSLNDRTLVAEGLWKSETQQTCMVACPAEAVIANVSRDCNIRICLQLEAGFSLEKRSMISGTISSTLLNNESGAFNPLSFSMPLHRLRPRRLPLQGLSRYTFNHIEEARKFGEKFKLDNAQSTVKTTVFRYPTLHGNDSIDYLRLSEELSINSLLTQQNGRDQNLGLRFQVIAIGNHVTFGDESDRLLDTIDMEPLKPPRKLINPLRLAAHIRIYEGHYEYDLQEASTAVYAAEGLYEPNDGKMYMVGCRAVNASWSVLRDNKKSLNGSLDCSLTLYLEFPSKIGAWLSSARVKVWIRSTRTVDDPFHFNPIYYETFPIMYIEQPDEVFSRRNVEGALSAAAFSVMIFGVVVQLFHMSHNQDSASFISLTMLGLQGIGYMLALFTEAEALLTRTIAFQPLVFDPLNQHIKLIIKFLTLVTLLLILRLFQRVWKQRNSQAHKTAAVGLTLRKNLPQETKVILICGLVHFMNFLNILFFHAAVTKSYEQPFNIPPFVPIHGPMPETSSMRYDFLFKWIECWQTVQDLFLFPQVVGNALWNVKGKPLHPMYYIGSTIVQLLPHLYIRLSSPVYYPYGSYRFAYVHMNADSFNRDNKIVTPLLAIVLVLVVYIQQKWNGWLVVSRPTSY
ncbi:unnamed protein product [Sphagnum troendelagicum]|uniref:RING-type E3 ubiquitin transferase n=1 Tax=Sphagnum troendelagicum TaxID=128251 RepID=A0ABP0UUA9_9BRYO